ncbi:TKL/TKL-ccin protein kinase [Lentinula detonsa]|uniref:TKL/TKL-ccin protein kinase n=1 Tax=Lentinula detonsa TaxID=2804962 RepID=A0A9W8NXN4_9AGAR|nr:TKL/TKL-ccin protein kinase [Lentinula detonsa]
MMNDDLRAPRTPTDSLRLESIKILAKLELIIEFKSWIPAQSYQKQPAYERLFDCFSLGAPLGILLDLLGSPAPSNVDVDNFDFSLSFAEREEYMRKFIQRVHVLELQGRLSFGEVMRVEDLFNGTSLGFMKVLKTVNRILSALQDSYPGLFVIRKDAESRKSAAMYELVESERIHVEFLRMVIDHAAFLSCESKVMETMLESLVAIDQRLRQYHDGVLHSLQQLTLNPFLNVTNWETLFSFDKLSVQNNIASTYRSLCTSYVSLYEYFEQIMGKLEPVPAAHAQMLLDILSYIPTRISDYCEQLQNILSLILPDTLSSSTTCDHFESLCNAIFKMTDISVGINEMSCELRTLRAVKILKGRAFHWHSPGASGSSKVINPSELGTLILDDELVVEDTDTTSIPAVYQIFLFESMLLCCLDGPRSNNDRLGYDEERMGLSRYPIRPWELGPALSKIMPLNLIYAIPTSHICKLRVLDSDSLELDWNLDSNASEDRTSRAVLPTQSLSFKCPSGKDQHNQWCSALERFAYLDMDTGHSKSHARGEVYSGFMAESPDEDGDVQSLVLSEDFADDGPTEFAPFDLNLESNNGRRHSHPRPWSLIARKGPYSESSSLHQQLLEEQGQDAEDDILSPNMLPTLFTSLSLGSSKGSIPPSSPLALGGVVRDPGFQHMLLPPTPPPEGDLVSEIASSEQVMDFTGQISLLGGSAVAGGGYSDVWKATLNSRKDGHGQELKVAVKVIRSHYGSSENESILKRRLARELDVWKQLKHPNILPLYGVTSGFGPYDAMVCPWMENGSVSRYMEKWGDILSMTDRLQLLCEVAEGLRYLHRHGIVHGDLTGSNILIDDNQHACLCDFGLSNIISDFQSVSSTHSTISGAIRWADATLFMQQATQSGESDEQEQMMPTLTTKSDIYSFGSVTLEILSGRIPYHYIRGDAQVIFELAHGRKPRRPTASIVTDSQWEFILSRCWHDVPDLRPDIDEVVNTMQRLLQSSLEFRRYTSTELGELSLWSESSSDILFRRHSEPLSSVRLTD